MSSHLPHSCEGLSRRGPFFVGNLWAKRYRLKSDSPDVIGESPPRCAGLVRALSYAVLVRALSYAVLVRAPRCALLVRAPRCALLVRALSYAVLVRAPRCALLVRAPRCDSFGKSPARDVTGLSKVTSPLWCIDTLSPQSEPRGSLLVTRNKSADAICSVGVAHCM